MGVRLISPSIINSTQVFYKTVQVKPKKIKEHFVHIL